MLINFFLLAVFLPPINVLNINFLNIFNMKVYNTYSFSSVKKSLNNLILNIKTYRSVFWNQILNNVYNLNDIYNIQPFNCFLQILNRILSENKFYKITIWTNTYNNYTLWKNNIEILLISNYSFMPTYISSIFKIINYKSITIYFLGRLSTLFNMLILIMLFIIFVFLWKQYNKFKQFWLKLNNKHLLKKIMKNFYIKTSLIIIWKFSLLFFFFYLLFFNFFFFCLALLLLFIFKFSFAISCLISLRYYNKNGAYFNCIFSNDNKYMAYKCFLNIWVMYTRALGYDEFYYLIKNLILKMSILGIFNIIILLVFSISMSVPQILYIFFYLLKNLTLSTTLCLHNLFESYFNDNIKKKSIKILKHVIYCNPNKINLKTCFKLFGGKNRGFDVDKCNSKLNNTIKSFTPQLEKFNNTAVQTKQVDISYYDVVKKTSLKVSKHPAIIFKSNDHKEILLHETKNTNIRAVEKQTTHLSTPENSIYGKNISGLVVTEKLENMFFTEYDTSEMIFGTKKIEDFSTALIKIEQTFHESRYSFTNPIHTLLLKKYYNEIFQILTDANITEDLLKKNLLSELIITKHINLNSANFEKILKLELKNFKYLPKDPKDPNV